MAQTDGQGPRRGAWLAKQIESAAMTPAMFAHSAGLGYQTIARLINGGATGYGQDILFMRVDAARKLTRALARFNTPEAIVDGLLIPPAQRQAWLDMMIMAEQRRVTCPSIVGPLSMPIPCIVEILELNELQGDQFGLRIRAGTIEGGPWISGVGGIEFGFLVKAVYPLS